MEGEPLEDWLDVPEFFGDDNVMDAPETVPGRPTGEGKSLAERQQWLRDHPAPRIEATPRVKDASIVLPTSPAMAQALDVAQRRGDVVTSGAEGYPGDGVHTPTSWHYRGLAIDVRFAADVARQIGDYLRAGYRVLREATHLHISHPSGGGAGAGRGW